MEIMINEIKRRIIKVARKGLIIEEESRNLNINVKPIIVKTDNQRVYGFSSCEEYKKALVGEISYEDDVIDSSLLYKVSAAFDDHTPTDGPWEAFGKFEGDNFYVYIFHGQQTTKIFVSDDFETRIVSSNNELTKVTNESINKCE